MSKQVGRETFISKIIIIIYLFLVAAVSEEMITAVIMY